MLPPALAPGQPVSTSFLPVAPCVGEDCRSSRRPIPTPCRRRNADGPEALCMLLEEALAQPGNDAMFQAATLLDTLVEHFSEASPKAVAPLAHGAPPATGHDPCCLLCLIVT